MAATVWKLVVHGGAGVIDRKLMKPAMEQAFRAALGRVLDGGSTVLAGGGNALDAVEIAVRLLEDDPLFNAARGAALTIDGVAELDASIMDGRTRDAGAVAGVTRTKNPISLARAVMERSEHVLLGGAGADAFARQEGLEQVEPDYFIIENRRRQLEDIRGRGAFDARVKFGTVGAVAIDVHGHVAAATSTGGLTGKRWGRIGDSPLIGAGTYADDRVGAVSATGSGEHFIRAVAAHEICARIRLNGRGAQQAADAVIADIGVLGGNGGVIMVTADGDGLWSFNSEGMYRAMASAEERRVEIFKDG